MKKLHTIVWLLLGIVLSVVLSIGLTINPVTAADEIDANAQEILQSMSSYLAKTQAFTVDADVDLEIVNQNGQKLQFSSFATVVLQRPNKFHIERKGMIADTQFVFDGKTLTVYSNKSNIYAQIESLTNIDDAIRAFESQTGIPAPGADLLFADPYSILSSGVKSGSYLGTTIVNGVEVYHLAFREDQVDWQLWVATGDQPLPMKYVITSKWVTSAPQYQIRFRNWNTSPEINQEQFTFSPPAGATRLETLPTIELEEFTSTEEK